MPVDDLSDPNAALRAMQKKLQRTPLTVSGGGGDGSHLSTGDQSVAIGQDAEATGYRGVAIGGGAWSDDAGAVAIGELTFAGHDGSVALGESSAARDDQATALGFQAYADHLGSTALGAGAETTADHQLMLGTASDTVVAPGVFSNPSARRLKQNIIPAPPIDGLFPQLHEYEYKTRPGVRRVGYIADDMVGTGAERFVQFNNTGDVEGVAYLDMHTAQIAALLARIERLEDELRNRNG